MAHVPAGTQERGRPWASPILFKCAIPAVIVTASIANVAGDELLPWFIAFLVLAIGMPAVLTDFREQRIPNLAPAVGIALGFIAHLAAGGLAQGLLALLAGLLAGLFLFLPYLGGATGAGDVKLMAAMGTLAGLELVFAACLFTMVAGALMATAATGLRSIGDRVPVVFRLAPRGGLVQRRGELRIPYAMAIVAGTLGALVFIEMVGVLVPLKVFGS